MKKVLIILSVLMAVAVLASGMTIAYAKDNGHGTTPSRSFSDEWLMGKVDAVNVNYVGNGTITVEVNFPGNTSKVDVTVNSDTKYRSWSAPSQDITFADLENGDWVAVYLSNHIAKEVILLEVPFRLNLSGNVTAVNVSTHQVIVLIKGGGSFTIDLSNAGANILGNISRIQVGQPVSLTIGNQVSFFYRYFPGLHLGWYIGNGNQGVGPLMKNKDLENKMENLRQKLEQRYEKWHEQGHD
jgi:hypothetical protein